MYDLKELQAFTSVVRTGSLTVSCRELALPKSTLSRRIRQLEEAVGQPLLLRQSKRIFPNDAGRLFYQYCQEILALIAQGHEALDELREGVTGVLELRCHEAFIRGWFSGTVESFMEEHEGLEVSIRTQQQPPDAMRDAICIWLGKIPDGNFRCEVLGYLTQGVYGSPAYFRNRNCPQSPSELGQHIWIDMLGGDEQGVELRHSVLGSCPIRPRAGRFSVDQYCVQGDAIAAGRGVGLIPHWLAERRLAAHPGQLKHCMTEWQGPVLPVALLYPHGILPRRSRMFVQHLRASIPSEWRLAAGPSRAVPESGTYHSAQ